MNTQQSPRLRFKGFIGEWEDKILGEVADVRDGTHDSPIYQNQGIPLVTSKNLTENGLDLSNVSLISQEDYEEINKRSKVESGDILLGLIGTIGKPVLVKAGGYAIKNVGLIKELSEVKNKFLLSLLQSNIFETYVSQKNTGNTQKFLALDGLRNFEFLAPTLPEQTQLGNFFRDLDRLLAESRAVWEKNRQLKKAMLAKMFPTNGKKIPEIRFKGFDGEWEMYQIRDLFRITRGNILAATELSEKSDQDYCYPVYSSQTKNNGLMGYWKKHLFENAITWTTDGANAGNVNFRSGKFYCTNVCGVLINESGFANQCIAEILNLVTHSYVSYVGNPKLMNNVMAEIPIVIPPTIEEQTAIGNFFRQLDETIALQAAEIEKLTQLKKGLLAAMLV